MIKKVLIVCVALTLVTGTGGSGGQHLNANPK